MDIETKFEYTEEEHNIIEVYSVDIGNDKIIGVAEIKDVVEDSVRFNLTDINRDYFEKNKIKPFSLTYKEKSLDEIIQNLKEHLTNERN